MSRLAAILAAAAVLAACAGRPTMPVPDRTEVPPRLETSPRARSARDRFVDDALAMVGRPYRYGGDAPRGFDCSGLVYYAARRAGIELPRTTEAQIRAGSPVARRSLRAGDLVFMRFPRRELHVGIMLGRRRFVHAPSSGERVRIDTLADPVYSRTYLRARRLSFPR